MRTVAIFLALSSAAAAQVTGTIRYEDRTYDATGFTGTLMRPVRQALVEIVRSSDNTLFNTGATDDTGAFSIGAIPAGEVVRFRVLAKRSGGGINAVVQNNDGATQTYAVLGPPIDTSVTTSFGTIDLTIAGGAAPAFNIFDAAVKSFQYLATLEPALPAVPPLLTLYWEAGTSNGTYYERTVNAVYLLGLTSDPDQYDDDIILHEIGHWVAFNFSKDDSLGGAHTIVDQLDARTSWSEGWAHYWSAVVRRYFPGEYSAPQLQVDNFGVGQSSFDVEGPSFPVQAVMATNELAVACVLWDITDAANEPGFDGATGNEIEIWRVMTLQIPPRTNITLEDFHAGLGVEAPGLMAGVTGSETTPGIFKDRLIRYYADGSEPNDSAGAATPLALGPAGLTLRTFYAAGDGDWYVVNATAGTLLVETLNLGDGADTLLEVFDAAGAVMLASNDNRSSTDLSSQISMVVVAPTTFRIHVTAQPGPVEYGYYDLRAQIVVNAPPVILGVRASRTSGTVPLRVTFDADVSDVDGGSHEYQWDFNGDGRADWSSLTGPRVTMTYDQSGSFLARLRVIDSGDSIVTAPILITVLPAPGLVVAPAPTPPAGAAPLSVAFSASVGGGTATSYSWDFDGDGIPDSVSLSSPAATFVFRAPGTVFPRLLVRNDRGVATTTIGSAITVSVGASPPSISSFAIADGLIPYAAAVTVAHSDLGAGGVVEVDLDGDGRYDVRVAPGSPSGTTFLVEIQRAGQPTARVRVTDTGGQSSSATAAYSARSVGATGWMVDPRAGDHVSGRAVALTAEAVPAGVLKTVRFQRRDSPGGAWIDIGPAIVSTGTLFSTSWNTAGIADLSPIDLRILVDGTASSGDAANTVIVDKGSPTVSDDGTTRTRVVQTDRTLHSRHLQGAWVILPMGCTADALPLSLKPDTVMVPAGPRFGSREAKAGWRIGFDGDFVAPFRLRLPYTIADGAALEMQHYDDRTRRWSRLSYPHVSASDRWVEAEAVAPGFYALVGGAPEADSGGGGCGATGLEAILGIGLAWALRRRRC